MKKIAFLSILFIPILLSAQIGIKAGVNFANVTNASEINNESRSGFMAGLFIAPQQKASSAQERKLCFQDRVIIFRQVPKPAV